MIGWWRRYRLAAAPFNMPPSVQDDQSAVELDWLLKIDEAVNARQRRELDRARD